MAAYAATVTSPLRKPMKIGNDTIVYYGTVDITNYNTTLAEITGITGKFRDGAPIVVLSGMTDNNYGVTWISASKSIKAFEDNENATYLADQAFGEVATDVDVGAVGFIAIGLG